MSHGTALIVGVGPGLGRALAETFASSDYQVVAAARSASALAASIDGIHAERIELFDCDTTEPGDVERLFVRVGNLPGPLEVAVYNASAFAPGSILDVDPADFERCWRIGCLGGFLVGQAAARAMLEHGSGTILFTGATASLRGGAGFANLASPKFALRALAQSMARELGPRGIHVAHVIIDG
ncbi:MAG TPA: SDR family NAD(P)-dependent oxidoreductase, partial [Gammaproteobacteria bacterium]|nr:SDR family NAD(P)-dependent oxidoreductase [Gammaproteobacteria bacterium]